MRNDGWPFKYTASHHAGDNPCWDCTSRQFGCHGKCEAYREWKQKADCINADVRRQKVPMDIEAQRATNNMARAIKRR